MTGYYDIVLALIPVALVGITAALSVAGLALTVAAPIGSLVALGLIAHAMFVRSPIDPDERSKTPRPRSTSSERSDVDSTDPRLEHELPSS